STPQRCHCSSRRRPCSIYGRARARRPESPRVLLDLRPGEPRMRGAVLRHERSSRRGTPAEGQSTEGGSPMPTMKQVAVFRESKPGRLANVLSALAREKVNIAALSVMDSHEHSVLRVVVNDVPRTVQVLNSLNTPHAQSEVLVVELRNQPGALAH